MKKLCFFGEGLLFQKKIAEIWAKVFDIWKIEVWESTIVEITGRRSCYFISLNIVYINLIASTQEQK